MPALQTQPSVAQPSRPLLALLGAIAGENDGIAIFLDTSTKTVFRLKTGEDHLGWTLDTVDRREVTLRRGPESIVLAIPTPAK